MEFRLLGPMEVLAANGLVHIGPTRQRMVLAALLVDAGRPVMVDTVIDRVWGEAPPSRARHALYVYIARIRRILTQISALDDCSVQLVRRPSGYTLDVDPDRIDTHRFGRLVGQGHDLRGQEARQAALLREALKLWRGTPLADLPGEWVLQMREAWRRQHLDAAMMWARAESHTGNLRALLRPLTALVAEYPLVEPLAAELMRALQALGLSAEALQCYTDLRLRLVQELGIEPGPELQELHRAVLRGQVSTASASLSPSPAAIEPSTTVPRQLPAAAWPFVGRPEELHWLTQLSQQPDRSHTVVISAIDGAAGIGKTSLAIQWGHRNSHRFPDGQLHIDLRGFDSGGVPVEPSAAIRAFLDALDVPPQRIPAGLDAQAALLRSRLAGKRMLLLLDNARNAEQVRPLLPGTAGCLVIVTSRHQLTALSAAEGASTLTLGLLSTKEARELLAARLGADRVGREPAAVDEIIARCGNLPLALVIAAARTAASPQFRLAAIAADMRESSTLDAFDTGDPGLDIRSVFSWSYAGITAAAARLFRLLGLHPGPAISLAAAASLVGEPVALTRRLLAELTRAHLIAEYPSDRYVFHDLLRLFASEQAHSMESQAQRDAATHRLLDHYLHTAHTADRLISPHRDPITPSTAQPGSVVGTFTDERQALEWFAGERLVLLALIDHAVKTGRDTHTCQLDWTLAHYLYRCGQWIDQAATGRAAVTAAHRSGDPTAQVRAHHNLARAHLQLGNYDLAYDQLQAAIRLADDTDDLAGQGDAHHVLSWVLERQGRHSEAFAHATQALSLFEAAGHLTGRARTLNTIGWFHAQLGNHETAVTFCQSALALHQKLGNREGLAATWHSLGFAEHNLGHYEVALRCYHHALALFTDLQNRYDEAATLDSLGDTHCALGNLDAACAAWHRALPNLEALNHPHAEQVRVKLDSYKPRSAPMDSEADAAYGEFGSPKPVMTLVHRRGPR